MTKRKATRSLQGRVRSCFSPRAKNQSVLFGDPNSQSVLFPVNFLAATQV